MNITGEITDLTLQTNILFNIIESAQIEFFVVESGKIILENGLDKITGISKEKIIGKSINDIESLVPYCKKTEFKHENKIIEVYILNKYVPLDNINKLIEVIPAGAIYLNYKGEVINYNNQAIDISRIYNQNVVKNKDLCLNTFFKHERIFKDFESCVKKSNVLNKVKDLLADEHTVYFLEYSFIPFYNESTQQNDVLFIIENKSEELVKQEELIRILTALDNTGVGIITTDKKYNISYVNRSAVNMWGFENNGSMIRDINLNDLLDEESISKLMGHWNKMVSERVYYFSDEMMAIHKDGTKFPVEIKATLITDVDENPVGITVSVSDITEQITSRDELVKAKEMAEESDRLKSAFLANMSHEIRTPMNGILGFSNLLRKKNISDELRDKYVNLINTNGELLIKIIDDIIDLAKIESGQLKIIEHECNIDNLFIDIYNFFDRYIKKQKKQNVSLIKSGNNDNFSVILDSLRLKQVMMNLIDNAIKFTSEGRVEYGFSFEGTHQIMFYVKDTGIGIPYEKQQLIFDRFLQLDDSPAREHGGTGLGLTICKYLVEMMGGKIWVESRPGEGANFKFIIPYKISKPHRPAITDDNEIDEIDSINWQDKTILITEDEDNNYYLLEEFLRDTGAEIIWAKDGIESIKLFKNNNIDLVLLDIKIPNLSGYEVVKEIKKINSNVPVIAQTAYALTGDKEKILKAGCDDYIPKPIDMMGILSIINKYINSD